ncbi:RnfABCDGE type electron transport complex subunit B [bacterium]|nr:RnfABCDGE type electron transport complex subunit B [bacterium]
MWPSMLTLGGVALFSALGLGIASRFLAVETDPRIKQITDILPGANCGGCGFAGCSGFADALIKGKAEPGGCSAGGIAVAQQVGNILGIKIESGPKKIARVFCRGGIRHARDKYSYTGVKDCKAAAILAGGPKACEYGCLGMGTCLRACTFGAISMGPEHIPVIDTRKCTGCGKCAAICPKNVIRLVPEAQRFLVLCNSHDKGKTVKDVCQIGCIACQICVKKCPAEAIRMEDSLAVIDSEKCTACGICQGKCPQKVIFWTDEQGMIFVSEEGKTVAKAC